ncbi:hypothetical protein V1478_010557 [Vespula squamosa]|uniref:Uncharacterized protein n=1 Tax=Vespula squamosa TaxID=30214 RepID=A0ABD2AIT1_VESSQ
MTELKKKKERKYHPSSKSWLQTKLLIYSMKKQDIDRILFAKKSTGEDERKTTNCIGAMRNRLTQNQTKNKMRWKTYPELDDGLLMKCLSHTKILLSQMI